MPPLNGIDRGINGEMLKALEELGHGSQIAVVDASYDIPAGTETVDYQGDSTAKALAGILKLVPRDEDEVVVMIPDDTTPTGAYFDIQLALLNVGARNLVQVQRHPVQVMRHDSRHALSGLARQGFYRMTNDPEKHTLFVRTRDEQAYACAMFVVGHSQK